MKKISKYELLLIYTVIRKILELNCNFRNSYFIIEILTFGILLIMIAFDIKKSKFVVKKKDMLLLSVMIIGEVLGFAYSFFSNNVFNIYFYRIIEFIECFYLLYMCIDNEENFQINNFERILKVIIGIAFISALYAVIFQFNSSLFKVSSNNNFRMDNIYQSFLGHRNQFGITLVAGILACMYFVINDKFKKKMILLSSFFLINLIFTYSRASYVALLCFAFWYFIMAKRSLKEKITIIIAIAIIIGIGLQVYNSNYKLKYFVEKYMIRSDSGMTGREVLWEKAVNYLNVPTWIFGRGWGISRIILQGDTVGNGVGFHNMYLTDLITGGMILLSFFFILLFSIWKKLNIKNIDIKMVNYFKACIFAFLVYSFFEVTDFFKIAIQQTFQTFFCITLPLLYIKLKQGEKDGK